MQRITAFFIPCKCSAVHTLISPDVDIFVRSTGVCFQGYVFNDVKVFKRGSQVICVYGAICVVSASSSPVSRVISEPKEVGSFDEVSLPIWGRDKQTTPDICAEFVEYIFRWSRDSYHMLESLLVEADGFQRP